MAAQELLGALSRQPSGSDVVACRVDLLCGHAAEREQESGDRTWNVQVHCTIGVGMITSHGRSTVRAREKPIIQ
jgi:hypothetical protein